MKVGLGFRPSFASAEYAGKKHKTRPERFLEEMNAADVAHGHELLHGHESAAHGDSGYTELDKRAEVKAAQEEGRLGRKIDWRIAMKRGQLKAMPERPAKALYE